MSNEAQDQPRVVYVERQPSSWAWFTPLRTFVLIVVVALIVGVSIAIYSSNQKMERAQQNLEQSERDLKNAKDRMWDEMYSGK